MGSSFSCNKKLKIVSCSWTLASSRVTFSVKSFLNSFCRITSYKNQLNEFIELEMKIENEMSLHLIQVEPLIVSLFPRLFLQVDRFYFRLIHSFLPFSFRILPAMM